MYLFSLFMKKVPSNMVKTTIWLALLIATISGCRLTEDIDQTPAFLYLGWDENGQAQVFHHYSDGESSRITSAEDGVVDFAVAPDGNSLIYSTSVVDSTNSLWQVDRDGHDSRLILKCLQAECGQPVWAPDGRRLIYEQRNIGEDGIAGSPYLSWIDTETGETKAVLENSEARGMAVSFSTDGQWLSYYSPEEAGAVIYNLQNGQRQIVNDEIGVPISWSPSSDQIVVPDLDLVIIHGEEGDDHLEHTHDYETAVHLFVMDEVGSEARNISGALKVEDSVPAWSPNEDWIAFGRRFPGTASGRQLWLMRPDGTESRALTDDHSINYGPPLWSPDGRYLLFQRYEIDKSDGEPGVWLLDVETGHEIELVSSGMQPAWLVDDRK